MLIALIMKPFFIFINFLIATLGGFFGSYQFVNEGFEVLLDILGYGVYFMGFSTFNLVIGSIAFWFTVDIAWAVIEWIYIKIPGVN